MVKDTLTPTATSSEKVTTEQPRNFLVTFLLAMNFGILGLRHFYLGDKKLGWVRIGLLLSYLVFMIMGLVFHLGGFLISGALFLIAAGIWALVDFFYVYYAVRTDADGQPLTTSLRDQTWAKWLFWITIIVAVIYCILLATIVSIREAENRYDGSLFSEPDSSRTLDYNFENL